VYVVLAGGAPPRLAANFFVHGYNLPVLPGHAGRASSAVAMARQMQRGSVCQLEQNNADKRSKSLRLRSAVCLNSPTHNKLNRTRL